MELNELQQPCYTRIVNKDGTYNIIEIPTEQVLFKQICGDRSLKLLEKFNKSKVGFCGWTPSFVLNTETLTKNNVKEE